ncbi:hypothetical protein BH10BAC2_BH10BAC2_27010 [soil metagenome]
MLLIISTVLIKRKQISKKHISWLTALDRPTMTNYYKILGVQNFASTEEIKTAYRKLSKKLHPDVNENDPFFTEKFKELQEAYENLSHSFRKSRYDALLRDYLVNLNGNNTGSANSYKKEEPEYKPEEKKESSTIPAQRKKPVGSVILGIIIFAGIGFRVATCNSSTTKANESSTAANNIASDSAEIEPQTIAPDTSTATAVNTQPVQTEKYIVISDKAYFFQSSDLGTKKSSYVLKDDIVQVENVTNDFAYAIYTTSSGIQSKGWLLVSDIQKQLETPNVGSIEPEDTEDYFTVGSSKKTVLRIQGDPTRMETYSDHEEWFYPEGTIDFADDKVTDFSNPDNRLKIKMINESERSTNPTAYFTIGSPKKGVLRVQGQPTRTETYSDHDEWFYPEGTIDFVDDKVRDFNNPDKRLKIKLLDERERNTSPSAYFTIGSPKRGVLRVQGDPIRTETYSDHDEWFYPEGIVKFVDGKVISFSNPDKRLKIKL